MKKVKLLFMSMLLAAMPAILSSCGSDDDGPTQPNKQTGPRLTRISHGPEIFYDSQGKIKTVIRGFYRYELTYTSNQIKVKQFDTDENTYSDDFVYTLKDGLITRLTTHNWSYTRVWDYSYDSNRHLIRQTVADDGKIWEEYTYHYNQSGDLTTLRYNDVERGHYSIEEYSYNNIPTTTNYNYAAIELYEVDNVIGDLLSLQGYYGDYPRYMLASVLYQDKWSGGWQETSYSYTMNSDGTVNTVRTSGYRDNTYYYTWE